MTREEEIINAARECKEITILASPSTVLYFEAGAKWADQHPNNVWHDVSETPIKNKLILVEVVNTLTPDNEIRYYVEYVEEWVINLMKTEGFQVRWAYIKDLLPKGGKL